MQKVQFQVSIWRFESETVETILIIQIFSSHFTDTAIVMWFWRT